jgi:hypothetical protein
MRTWLAKRQACAATAVNQSRYREGTDGVRPVTKMIWAGSEVFVR